MGQTLSPWLISLAHELGELIPLEEAEGLIAYENITVYPPGIPLVFPGQILSKEIIHGLLSLLDMGGLTFHGIEYKGLGKGFCRVIKV